MLADLDELVMTCSDPRSRTYLKESVQCYKAGAYRSSVVACWIAVAFDLVDKIRELAAAGDQEAQVRVAEFERIQNAHDVSGALKFEKELPDMALNKFEFISPLEHLDLVRLVEDRNRCAHPSQVSDNQVFEASAELARLHISNSVKSILSQPAAQGKAALDRVMEDLESRYFPSEEHDVFNFLSAGPLCRPRKSLFLNFLKILVKTLTNRSFIGVKQGRAKNALLAIKKMHPELWEEEFSSVVNQVMGGVKSDADFASAAVLMVHPRKLGAWQALSNIEQLRLAVYVEDTPSEYLEILDDLFDLPKDHKLFKAAKARIDKTSFEEFKKITWLLFVPDEAFDRLLDVYANVRSFASANEVGRTVRSLVGSLVRPREYVEVVAKIASDNDQIKFSNELVNVLQAFSSDAEVGVDFVNELAARYNLEVLPF